MRGVPALARPSAARAGALIRWEADGAAVSQDWLRVAVLPGASHHSIPAEQAGPLSRLLLDFLPAGA